MSSTSEPDRVLYDASTNNGYIFNNEHYIPEELLLDILSNHIDYKTLRSCQLVCKQWNSLIRNYVWRKKAELILNHTLPVDENIPWSAYYHICHKRPFNRNLIKNHSGQKVLSSDHGWKQKNLAKCPSRSCTDDVHYRIGKGPSGCDWIIINDGGDGWAVEAPPQGVPALPDDPVFNGKNTCFTTSFHKCWKQQVIDLVKEGISAYLLDNWQPIITVSEWFSSRYDCGSVYACTTELITDDNDTLSIFNYSKVMKNEEQNQWFKYEHEFKNYGKGLRKITFSHGGQDSRCWSGHYGSKMSGACIKLKLPESIPREPPPAQEQPASESYYPTNNNVAIARVGLRLYDWID